MTFATVLRLSFILLFMTAAAARSADWPPSPDAHNTVTQTLDGRTIQRFTHGPRPQWGYPASPEWQYSAGQETGPQGQNHNSFYVVSPRNPHKNAPLCVILHSANRTAFDYLGYQFLNRKIAPDDRPGAVMTGALDDAYILYLNSTNDEWWGWSAAHGDPGSYAASPTPTEKRVFHTIAWVMAKYKIDPNRVYLSGVSMGGCGTLALGACPARQYFCAPLWRPSPQAPSSPPLRMGFPSAADLGRIRRSSAISGRNAYPPPGFPTRPSSSISPPRMITGRRPSPNYCTPPPPDACHWSSPGPPSATPPSAPPPQNFPHDAITLAYPWMEIP